MITIFGYDNDPAMRWEALVRSIYNCEKYGDPNNYAHQEFFSNFIESPNRRAKAALPFIIGTLKDRFPYNDELESLMDRAENFDTQEEAIDIIDEVIAMAHIFNLS